MELVRTKISIEGMTCINCQNKIEQAVATLSGVQEISVDYQKGTAHVIYDSARISLPQIKEKIEELDYRVLSENQAADTDISRTISFLAIIVALYILLEQFGVLNFLVPDRLADRGMGYGMLFLVGALTSVHCIAMCGGINLTQSLPGSADSQKKSSFSRVVLYNLGRVFSYTCIGFLLGFIGMMLGGSADVGIPVLIQGVLKLIAGLIMVMMGINMLGIFPWLRRFHIRMPSFLAIRIRNKLRTERRSFMIGILNGLMPCGPLQSMQILALASAAPFAGALSMLLFSLGTVPLMLGLGTIVSALGRKFAHTVLSVGAVLVCVLGLAMLSQGGRLTGMLLPDMGNASGEKDSVVQIMDGVQVVESTLESGRYPTITVQAGIPVHWTINAPEGSINGCNYRVIIGEYGIEHSFEEGQNVIEFTPTEAGNISYTCWMGMIKGRILVMDS